MSKKNYKVWNTKDNLKVENFYINLTEDSDLEALSLELQRSIQSIKCKIMNIIIKNKGNESELCKKYKIELEDLNTFKNQNHKKIKNKN